MRRRTEKFENKYRKNLVTSRSQSTKKGPGSNDGWDQSKKTVELWEGGVTIFRVQVVSD